MAQSIGGSIISLAHKWDSEEEDDESEIVDEAPLEINKQSEVVVKDRATEPSTYESDDYSLGFLGSGRVHR